MRMQSPDEFIREYDAALNAHDLEHALGLIADDAVYWFSKNSLRIYTLCDERVVKPQLRLGLLRDYCD